MTQMTRRDLLTTAGGVLLGATIFDTTSTQASANGEPGMILIPEGSFLMGTSERDAKRLAHAYGYHVSWLMNETPARTVHLAAYYIDKYPVTNRQYGIFCKQTGYPPRMNSRGAEPPTELLEHPVTFVNRADASAYANWAGKRLPTEAEWEKAARGTDGRLFPWGNRFIAKACRWNQIPGGVPAFGPHVASARQHNDAPQGIIGTAPVGSHIEGASPYGVMDMAGNVAEWCADNPGPNCGFIKGGCWLTTEIINLRAAARNMSGYDTNALPFYGFRCVKDVQP